MARIGDIYRRPRTVSQAAPYWERIPQASPGQSEGYLEAATIYWDYFDFDNAMRLLGQGRERLKNPNLYAYEAGAIYENQRDYRHAIDEYVKGALRSPNHRQNPSASVGAPSQVPRAGGSETSKIASGPNRR